MTVDELVKAIATRWPNAWPNDDTAVAWARDYRKQLGAHEGATLAAAWDRVMATWKSSAWPKPAMFVEAISGANHRPTSAATGSDDWRQRAVKRAEEFRDRKRRIGQAWFSANQEMARQAKDEGWLLALKDWVGKAANIMAQREEAREQGEKLKPLGARWPWCTDGPSGDEIISPPAETVVAWREAAAAYVPAGNAKARQAVEAA